MNHPEKSKVNVARLRFLIFGPRTEKTEKVLPGAAAGEDGPGESLPDEGTAPETKTADKPRGKGMAAMVPRSASIVVSAIIEPRTNTNKHEWSRSAAWPRCKPR